MRHFTVLCRLLTVAALFTMNATFLAAQQSDESETGSVVLVASIEGPIGPATVRHVTRVIGVAEERGAAALVLRINTPGGLADATREIVAEVLASPAPVIGYVAPSGAHAASAGTFILYSTQVAAMAPGTNLGAATPVSIGGMRRGLHSGEGRRKEEKEDGARDKETTESDDARTHDGPSHRPLRPENAMAAKATNDAVAMIRSLAEMHGRNADWAESAVREAASLSASAALERHVIDIVASDMAELLSAADGRTVEMGGEKRTLVLTGATVETIEMDAITRALSVLSNPNIALILMMIGVYGLIFEFWSPGAIVPGVVGAISLMLGLYALNQLPLDYAGLALITLGVAFMVAEALTPTIGVLGIAGLAAFVIGASMLVDTEEPAYQISWWMIGTMAAVSGAVLVLLLGFTLRAYRGVSVSGRARMIGAEARVLEWSGGGGFVWVEGERWRAKSTAGLHPGQAIRIRDIEGLTLIVEAVADDHAGLEQKGAS